MDFKEILSNISYLTFVFAYIKWISLFLIISIIILIVATRFKMFKRQTTTARILVKLYYIIIPIYFMSFAFNIAPIIASQIELNRAIDNNKDLAGEFAYNYLCFVLSDSIINQDISAKDFVRTSSSIAVNNYLDTHVYNEKKLLEQKSFKFGKKFIYKLKRKVEYGFLIKLTNLAESKIIKNSSDISGISNKTINALYGTDLKSLFRNGEIIEILRKELNRVFHGIYKSMAIIFLIGLTIPIAEIILAKKIKY